MHITEPFIFHDASGDRTVEWYMKVPQNGGHASIFWTNGDSGAKEDTASSTIVVLNPW